MASGIYLIRHGITVGNVNRWYYGWADVSLAEEGIRALEEIREEGLYPEMPENTEYFTTGLRRTEETFDVLFGQREHGVIEKLKEMNFGDYECHTYDELKDDEYFVKWCYDTEGKLQIPGGESKTQFRKRVSEGFCELMKIHEQNEKKDSDNMTVVVCHGGVISAIMQELFPEENANMWDWIPDPGYGYYLSIEDSKVSGYRKICK